MSRSLINLLLNFFQGDKHESIYILLHLAIQLNQHCLLKMFFLQVCISGLFIKNYLSICMWISFWDFNSIPLINMSVTVPCKVMLLLVSFLCSIPWNQNGTSSSSIIIQDFYLVSCVCKCVCFHVKLKIVISRFVNNCVEIFMWFSLNT